MLVIRTIKLSLNSQHRIRINKKVRVGYDQYICSNRKPPLVPNPSSPISTIQWRQDMTLPILYKRQLQFQFFPEHEFGYNPDEINQVLYAKVMIENYRRCCGEGLVVGGDGAGVGRLYFQWTVLNQGNGKYRIGNHAQGQVDVETKVSVSSMLAHFDSYHGENGHFEVWLDGQHTITPQITLIAGQLLWAQTLSLPTFHNLPESSLLHIHIFINNIPSGVAQIPVKSLHQNKQKFKKQQILHPKTKQKCGMLFIDINFQSRNLSKKQGKSSASTSRLGEVGAKRGEKADKGFLPALGRNNTHRSHLSIPKYEDKGIRSSNSERKLQRQVSQIKPQVGDKLTIKQPKPNPELWAIIQSKLGRRDRSQTILSKYLKYYK